MEYIDTGERDPDLTLYRWLSDRFPYATYFSCQTGYFRADGLHPFAPDVTRILESNGEVRLVIGANEDSISSDDLAYVLDLIEGHDDRASIVLVSADDVLMHSKTFYLELENERRCALVGSANLTEPGLAANIEAGLGLDWQQDSGAPFDQIKAAIEAWRIGGRPNAYLLSRGNLPELIAQGIVDRPRPVRPVEPTPTRRRRRSLFPPLGRLIRIQRRPRRRTRRPVISRTAPVQLGSAAPLPAGMVGIVKKLSRLDTKGFRGEPGTPYVALPLIFRDHLPMAPFGRNREPRIDVAIEARLDSALDQVVSSGTASTNITGVGLGTTHTSHRDLRLNILRAIVDGIRYVAGQVGAAEPAQGDVLAIEVVNEDHLRLTFITEEPLRSRLRGLCTESGNSWGWLQDGAIPGWA